MRFVRPLRVPRWLRLRSSIGLHLSLLALAIGVPFVVYVGGNAARQASIERNEASERSLALARLVAARVDDYVGDVQSALALVAYGTRTDAGSVAANDAFLRRIRADLPRAVDDAAVWTADGRNAGALDHGHAHEPIANRDLFRNAVTERSIAIEGPLPALGDGEPVLEFARPVTDAEQRVTGAVTLSTRPGDLQWLLDLKGTAPPDTVVSIVSEHGTVLTRNVDPERWIGTSVLGIGRARDHIDRREGVDETVGRDGVLRIAGYTQASRVPWHVFVAMPADTALSTARANVIETLVFGSISLLVGAAIAAFFGTRIARPLRQLAHDATILARGNLAHRSTVRADGEVRVLAATLNRLAQTVEERTRALRDNTTALEEKTAALERSTAELRTITANVPVLIAYVDADEQFRFVNAYLREAFGVAPADLTGRTLRQALGSEVYARLEARLRELRAGMPQTFETSLSPRDDGRMFMVSCFPDYGERQEVRGAYVVCQDITRRKQAEEALATSERRLRSIADNIPLLVAYIDRERRYRFNSRYYETWLGRPLEQVTGRPVREVLGPRAYAAVSPNLDRAFAGERVDFDVEIQDRAGIRFVRGSYVPDFDAHGNVVGVYSSSSDVTPLKEGELQLARLAQSDSLTGLPNRHTFNDGIAAALRRSQRAGTQVALMFLDIDGFKRINDSLGHAAGDEVLREFARRLTGCVRPTDLVARLAGDEFVIVLEGVHTREECRFVARKIIAAMRAGFRAGDASVKVTTSIGIALAVGGATTSDALLKRADSALYAAKGHGRDRYEMAV